MTPIELNARTFASLAALFLSILHSPGATVQRHYYGHDAVLDKNGVIAPWYREPDGQCDLRVRIAAETLKRYPWTTTSNAVAAYPDYLFTSKWNISSNGVITPVNPGDWMNGDLGQRSTSLLNGWVDYYRYSGDAAAIAHLTYMADLIIDHELTPADHPWSKFPISVPVKGKAYWDADPNGMIQIDISAAMALGILRAYEVTGNQRWFEAAKHWGDVFAEKCDSNPGAVPWPRYANPETVKWKSNRQTGSVVLILGFLNELIRLGYTRDGGIVAAREAGERYLRDQLLPRWTADETWGRYFWDWENDTQNCCTTADAAGYFLSRKTAFPDWRRDVRNILTVFLNHSSANLNAGGDVYSGAWAYPESSTCCGRSLWYAPLVDGAAFARYGAETGDEWMRELAYRQMVLQTYDVHESGVTEDNIDGGIIVNGQWLNIAHPWPLRWVLNAMSWLPEELGASRENHLMRSSAVVNSVTYGKGEISYSTFDAPPETIELLRLSFSPSKVMADGRELRRRSDLKENGFTVKKLSNHDTIVQIRHDGATKIVIAGKDPQKICDPSQLRVEGDWSKDNATLVGVAKGATVTATFRGNEVRLIGRADPFGGQAEVFLDGTKDIVPIDCWNPARRDEQVLYYKNGLSNGTHKLTVVALGAHNPYSQGDNIYVSNIQFSSEHDIANFPVGTGPTGAQRMIFGSANDYRDLQGNWWRPATEVVTRLKHKGDTVAAGWWTNASEIVSAPSDPELYRYGYHAPEFWVNVTVAPAQKFDVRLGFAATHEAAARQSCFDISINGTTVVSKLDVAATASGTGKAFDLLFKNILPRNGVIEVRFKGEHAKAEGDAFVQLMEVGKHLRGRGAIPLASVVTRQKETSP